MAMERAIDLSMLGELIRMTPMTIAFSSLVKMGGLLRLLFNATPFSKYQIEASEDLVNWILLESESNPVRMLSDGAEQIEVALPIDEIDASTPFLRVKARER